MARLRDRVSDIPVELRPLANRMRVRTSEMRNRAARRMHVDRPRGRCRDWLYGRAAAAAIPAGPRNQDRPRPRPACTGGALMGQQEQWRRAAGQPYKVSSLGRLRTRTTGRLIEAHLVGTGAGYMTYAACRRHDAARDRNPWPPAIVRDAVSYCRIMLTAIAADIIRAAICGRVAARLPCGHPAGRSEVLAGVALVVLCRLACSSLAWTWRGRT
jgi:hypothetical protein